MNELGSIYVGLPRFHDVYGDVSGLDGRPWPSSRDAREVARQSSMKDEANGPET